MTHRRDRARRLSLTVALLVGLLAPSVNASSCTFTYDGETVTGQDEVNKKVNSVFNDVYFRWKAMSSKWEAERSAWASEDEALHTMKSLKHNETKPISEIVKGIVKRSDSYAMTVNVVATMTGGLFMYIAKFGYLARIVGMVSPANIKATIVTDLLASAMGVLCWWAVGYGIAFGSDSYPESGSGLMGSDRFFPMYGNSLSDVIAGEDDSIHKLGYYAMFDHLDLSGYYAEFFLHMGLVIICVGIPVGTLAERATVTFTVVCTLILAIFIYPVIAHMFWHENGRFSAMREKNLHFGCGVIDTAGSGVVHATGAIVALSAAVIIESRLNRWTLSNEADAGGKPEIQPKPQYSPAFEAFGCVIIFVTSLATTAFCVRRYTDDGAAVGRAMLNTLLCSGTASISACVIGHFYTGVISPQLAGGGLIAGIATISSGCAVVTAEGAFVMGFIGGIAYYLGGALLVNIYVDDVSHAISMHGFTGICGLVMTGLFTHPDFYDQVFFDTRLHDWYESGCYGMLYNGGPTSTLAQAWGAMTIIAIAGTVSTVVFAIVHIFAGGRFSDKTLESGIDSTFFGGETRYADSAMNFDPHRFKAINTTKKQHEENTEARGD